MRYLPHTPDEIEMMLEVIGVGSIDDLFSSIPPSLRLKSPLGLPPALSELELRQHLRELSRDNAHGDDWVNFLGGGSYRHYIPSAVSTLVSRSEFSTSYTPYQPEVSQGNLQALFEFQTMVAEIFDMEIANASLYDGATAAAEAVLMALRLNKRKRVLLARSLHPKYRQVIQTYLRYMEVELQEVDYNRETGTLHRDALTKALNDEVSCVVIGIPNFFGIVEDLSEIAEQVHQQGGLLITATPEPFALALAKTPGEMGADIAVGEGQSFGNAMNFGGPSLGLFATREKFVRQVPGRLVGETTDQAGQRGYVLTLATREQHIRRERATSNICTNVSLCALAAAIALALFGKEGFRKIGQVNFERAERTKQALSSITGVKLAFSGTTFNEFVVRLPQDPTRVLAQLREEKIFGGLALSDDYPELENSLLICATEMNCDDDIKTYQDRLAATL